MRSQFALLPLLDGVVARCAKGLPVGTVPEQALVATVRNDVVNDGCGRGKAIVAALTAMRVHNEIFGAGLAPLMVIATGAGRWTA